MTIFLLVEHHVAFLVSDYYTAEGIVLRRYTACPSAKAL